jgi:hypothetical protein
MHTTECSINISHGSCYYVCITFTHTAVCGLHHPVPASLDGCATMGPPPRRPRGSTPRERHNRLAQSPKPATGFKQPTSGVLLFVRVDSSRRAAEAARGPRTPEVTPAAAEPAPEPPVVRLCGASLPERRAPTGPTFAELEAVQQVAVKQAAAEQASAATAEGASAERAFSELRAQTAGNEWVWRPAADRPKVRSMTVAGPINALQPSSSSREDMTHPPGNTNCCPGSASVSPARSGQPGEPRVRRRVVLPAPHTAAAAASQRRRGTPHGTTGRG